MFKVVPLFPFTDEESEVQRYQVNFLQSHAYPIGHTAT